MEQSGARMASKKEIGGSGLRLENAQRSIEAILFASGEAVTAEKIAQVLDIEEKTVKHLIEKIREQYQQIQSPFEIAALEDAYQMCTLPQYGDVIRAALELRRTTPLSQAAMEVLAVIAYNQPVTRAFVEQVRGVDCSSIVRGLVDKGLVEEAGRLLIPGKPISYRTTANFLRSFELSGLDDLPRLPPLPPEEAPTEEQVEGQMDFFE